MHGHAFTSLLVSLLACVAAVGADTGAVYVKSTPRGATVFVDGRLRGQTPVVVARLRPGTHTVVMRLGDVVTPPETVTVLAGKLVTLDRALHVAAVAGTKAARDSAAASRTDAKDNRGTVRLTAKPEPGLIGWWTFDDGEGRLARDSSGCGNHASVLGAAWTTGTLGGALSFDGIDDYVTITNESHFDLTGSLTVAAWIKVASFTKEWQSIVTKGDSAWRMQRNRVDSVLKLNCDGVAGGVVGASRVNDDRWHHVAGVYDGTSLRLYVDGRLDGSSPSRGGAARTNDCSVLIGANAERPGRFFHGVIDDVRIYNRALRPEAIELLAHRGEAPSGRADVESRHAK